MTALVLKAWQDSQSAYLAVRVTEASGPTEYVASVPLPALVGLTAQQQKDALIAAVKAQRDAQQAGATALGINGTVTI